MKKLLIFILNMFRLEINCFYDYLKFKKHFTSVDNSKKPQKGLEAWILQDKHRIEKGLSLPQPRLRFGEAVINRLVDNLLLFKCQYGTVEPFYYGVGALKEYKLFHQMASCQLSERVLTKIALIPVADFNHNECERSGVQQVTGLGEVNLAGFSFKEFCKSRHSCRNFSGELVDISVIESAINLSITAPSVCNRQHWFVSVLTGDLKNKMLALQNGNIGFTENIPHIAVISSDISAFYTPDERNQMYTDGGIFAMNLMYAFHSLGLGSCALNWCASAITELKLKRLNVISKSHQVILIVAFGNRNENGVFAKSPRMPSGQFYKVFNDE
jgi:nitroreductase